MKNLAFQPGQNVSGTYRCTDGWICSSSSTAKLANWPSQTGKRGTGRSVENQSITVMNAVMKPSRIKYVRKATHGSLISPVRFSCWIGLNFKMKKPSISSVLIALATQFVLRQYKGAKYKYSKNVDCRN